MKTSTTSLEGVVIIEPEVFEDDRGYFFEGWNEARYSAHGLGQPWVQDNQSFSRPGTIRGLHFQLNTPQAKLVRAIRGWIFDVVVDVRVGSPTFGKWIAARLSADNKKQMFIPEGFAHGFCVPESETEVLYKCSAPYVGEDQRGIRWDDPILAITWPVEDPILSTKDRSYEPLSLERSDLPTYSGL